MGIFLAFPQGPPSPPQPQPPSPPPITTLAPDAGDEPQEEDVDDSDIDGEEPDPAPLLILPPGPPPEPKEDDGMYIRWLHEACCIFQLQRSIFVSATVEHDLSGNTGRFATPNFPEKYKDNSKINWNITVDEGQKIQLTIHLMNVRIVCSRSLKGQNCSNGCFIKLAD